MDRWDDLPDEALLRVTSTKPEAFGAFYRRYEERILRFFTLRVDEPELAADLAAETFAAALTAHRRFRKRKEPAGAWLFGIARNILALSRRKGRIEARARQRLGMPQLVLTDEELERIVQLDGQVVELMEALPSSQREAVRARVVDELDYADVAAHLECSEAVARQRVSRGLRELRDEMGNA